MFLKKLLWSIMASLVLISCAEDDDDDTDLVGNWSKMSDYEGIARSDAAGFTIGSFGYVGTGYDGDERLNDYWAYDSENDYWVQIASFPGVSRNSAVSFSINSKGYVGTGYDGEKKLKDFWEYDPANNTWKKKKEFGGTGRYGAIGFSIGNQGFVGTGYDGNYLKDFWEFLPSEGDSGVWVQKKSIGGAKRRDAVAFEINGKGYVGTGINNGVYENDLWEYDPSIEKWTEKREIANINDDESYDDDYNIVRSNAVGFSINNKGYVATGYGSDGINKTVWEYDPVYDLWEQKTNFEGVERMDGVAFTIENSRAFFTTGRNSSYEFDDIWEFKPEDEYDEDY